MYDNKKIINIEKHTVIALVTKNGTVMGGHRIRRIDDKKVMIAYDLQSTGGASLTKKTHDANPDSQRAYYVLDMSKHTPRLCRAETCVESTSYPTRSRKRVLAFAGDDNGVKVTGCKDGTTHLEFTPLKAASGEEAVAMYAVNFRNINPDFVQKVQLVTLR